mmetsp:Transcript_25091/g.63869  ORF Transcript_25091/g.63869 Transcript_25091/m.63869 type:complete len:207 (+) Transcript_25091:1003-1623(+)
MRTSSRCLRRRSPSQASRLMYDRGYSISWPLRAVHSMRLTDWSALVARVAPARAPAVPWACRTRSRSPRRLLIIRCRRACRLSRTLADTPARAEGSRAATRHVLTCRNGRTQMVSCPSTIAPRSWRAQVAKRWTQGRARRRLGCRLATPPRAPRTACASPRRLCAATATVGCCQGVGERKASSRVCGDSSWARAHSARRDLTVASL